MGGDSRKKARIRKLSPEPSCSPSNTSSLAISSSDEDCHNESSSKIRRRRREKDYDRVEGRRSRKSRRDNEKDSKKKHSSRYRETPKRREKNKRKYHCEESSSESDSEAESAEDVVNFLLNKFPAVAEELEQLLRMIDGGQAVDISGLSEKSLVKHLRRLFLCLNLEDSSDKVFLLPHKSKPTLDVVGPIISSFLQSKKCLKPSHAPINADSIAPDTENGDLTDNMQDAIKESVGPQRRVIGPEMPSAELLAAAAKLTEAEAELREAELEGNTEFFIGPPPPAVVKEAATANEAERFEEITRIMGAAEDNPYDVLGVNNNMTADNMKKRYWKLSLMVHPDKCAHTQAQQAFVKLNKAFKDLQDPDKRKALDDKIKMEEQDAFLVELKAMREAAQWRRLQGISMEGDDLLLAQMEVKAPPKREDWMTTLPPERKPATGMSMKSTTSFSKNTKEGRGDTSVWTDTPSERAQKAKTNYLEAYNEAAALASSSKEREKNPDDAAGLVDKYNMEKRSKSMVEKHQESSRVVGAEKKKKEKKNSKRQGKDEWEGKHPWKPWDREKDLTAGRQNVKLDPDNMSQGLSSRFSSGFVQRNFL